MGLDRSGTILRYVARTAVTADDTVYPSGDGQASAVAVPTLARGSITHVRVRAVGSANGVQCRVTIFGLVTKDDNQWAVMAQLNSGSAITRTTLTAVANGNNINYLESFSHLSAMYKLYAQIDATASLAAGGVSVFIFFERP